MGCARPTLPNGAFLPRSNPYDLGELVKPLRDSLWTARMTSPTMRSTGRPGLSWTSLFRDPGRQWDLRHDRCPGRECDSRCKGYPITALPAQWIGGQWVGGSHHQHRKAADVGGVDLMWLYHNCLDFGLYHVVSSEKWHYERTREARVRLIEYPGWTFDGQPIHEQHRVWKPFSPGSTDESIAARNGLTNEVTDLQYTLKIVAKKWKKHDVDPGPIDGDYADNGSTEAAVEHFKMRVIMLQQQLKHKPVWPNWDGNVGHKTIDMAHFFARAA